MRVEFLDGEKALAFHLFSPPSLLLYHATALVGHLLNKAHLPAYPVALNEMPLVLLNRAPYQLMVLCDVDNFQSSLVIILVTVEQLKFLDSQSGRHLIVVPSELILQLVFHRL